MKNFQELSEMSKLTFAKEEEEIILKDLESMIKFVSAVEHAKPNKNSTIDKVNQYIIELGDLRDDVIRPSFDAETTHKNTPNRKNRFFTVPQVVE